MAWIDPLALVALGATVVAGIAFIAWLRRFAQNLPALGAPQARLTPRGATFWWFVPLLSYVMPYLRIADAARALAGSGRPPVGLIRAWWVTFAFYLASGVGVYWVAAAALGGLSGLREPLVALSAVSNALALGSALLAILVVRRLEALHDARSAGLATSPPADTGPSDTRQSSDRRAVVGVVAASLLVTAAAWAGVAAAQPVFGPAQAWAAQADGWGMLVSGPGAFSIELPGDPEVSAVEFPDEKGTMVETSHSVDAVGITDVVGYFDRPGLSHRGEDAVLAQLEAVLGVFLTEEAELFLVPFDEGLAAEGSQRRGPLDTLVRTVAARDRIFYVVVEGNVRAAERAFASFRVDHAVLARLQPDSTSIPDHAAANAG